MVLTSHYDILGVSPDATRREIKSAYHRLIKQYHPDYCPHSDEASRKTMLLNEAYRVCGNPDERKKYDRLMGQQGEKKGGLEIRVYSSGYCLRKIWLHFRGKHP